MTDETIRHRYPDALDDLLTGVSPLPGGRTPRVALVTVAPDLEQAREQARGLPALVQAMGGWPTRTVPVTWDAALIAEVLGALATDGDLVLLISDPPNGTGAPPADAEALTDLGLAPVALALDPELPFRWRGAGAVPVLAVPVLAVPADTPQAALALALFAWPVIRLLAGVPEPAPRTLVARCAGDLSSPPGRRSLVPVTLSCAPEGLSARLGPLTAHPDHRAPVGAHRAPGWLIVPEDVTAVAVGDRCAVLLAPGAGLLRS